MGVPVPDGMAIFSVDEAMRESGIHVRENLGKCGEVSVNAFTDII